MLWACRSQKVFDHWAATGNTGWDYRTMLEAMKKIEGNTDYRIVGDGTYHGTVGEITVSSSIDDSYLSTIESAFHQLGYPTLTDVNADQRNGFVKLQTTIKNGERCSGYQAFLNPIKNNPNVFIMKDSLVTNVIFEGARAVGVNVKTFEPSCKEIRITATKEVILSAGSYGSPKILLQSGIGKPEDLADFSVPFLADLPVGENLQDHLAVAFFIKFNHPSLIPTIEPYSYIEYLQKRSGPLAGIGLLNANAFINTLNNDLPADIQYTFLRFAKNQLNLDVFLANIGFKDEYISSLVAASQNHDIILAYTILLTPKSLGKLKLRSKNPSDPPIISTGFLNHVEDENTLLKGASKLFDLLKTPELNNVDAILHKFNIKECDSLAYDTMDYWRCYFKYFTISQWHPTSN